MSLNKQTTERYRTEMITFLKEKGWIVYEKESDKYALELYSNQLENIPYKPIGLIEKDKQMYWIFFFWKGAFPVWQSAGGQVTGFDWLKYQMMLGLTEYTHIPCAVLFTSEIDNKIIFRQLDQIPNPRHSFAKRPNCSRMYEPYHPLGWKCFKCWRDNPELFHRCSHEKRKQKTGMATWPKQFFGEDTSHQPNLI